MTDIELKFKHRSLSLRGASKNVDALCSLLEQFSVENAVIIAYRATLIDNFKELSCVITP